MNVSQRARGVIATTAVMLSLAACGQKEDATVGQTIDGTIAKTEQAGQAVAEGAADLAITTKVKAALAADDQLSAMSIEVNTEQGEVSLTGPAPNAEALERATVLAKAVDGVTAVNNQLVVSSNS